MNRPTLALSLFWRTFVLLSLLLAGGVFAWVQTLRTLESGPRAMQRAQQVADLVGLSRAALTLAESSQRAALLKSLGERTAVSLRLRQRSDTWQALDGDRPERQLAAEIRRLVPGELLIAASVNSEPGLWIGFTVDRERYWLRGTGSTSDPSEWPTWGLWIAIALFATLLGSVAIARLINRPLRDLSFAASRIREGDLDSRLDENTLTSEIREVNMGFNRMARELAKVEEDRAVMLAGISHDLRTPLARLRLEAEMSVADEEAKRNMALDIDQLDAIIDKFLDYARPGETQMRPINIAAIVDREAAAFRDTTQIRINSRLAIDLMVMADETELARVFANLFENARRYGRGTGTGVAEVSVNYARTGPWVIVRVRDQGPGVAPEKLPQLATPFFRGDAARTAATGAGLGLAIVDKSMQRMGGTLELANAPDGGLVAHLRLKRAP